MCYTINSLCENIKNKNNKKGVIILFEGNKNSINKLYKYFNSEKKEANKRKLIKNGEHYGIR